MVETFQMSPNWKQFLNLFTFRVFIINFSSYEKKKKNNESERRARSSISQPSGDTQTKYNFYFPPSHSINIRLFLSPTFWHLSEIAGNSRIAYAAIKLD